MAFPPVVTVLVKGELLKIGLVGPVDGCGVVEEAEEVALRTDAKGLPANCRRSSEALSDEEAGAAAAVGAGAAAAAPAGPETPKRSKMLGVPLSEAAGSGAAKGFVAF